MTQGCRPLGILEQGNGRLGEGTWLVRDEEVLAVPNPFRLDDAHRYPGGSNRIRFVNIPRMARIHIYNVSGDEIGLIAHPSRPVPGGAIERGEVEWNQFTKDAGGFPSPGVYYFVVENLTGSGKKVSRGTFVVIR